jgi:hypothetical protein
MKLAHDVEMVGRNVSKGTTVSAHAQNRGQQQTCLAEDFWFVRKT